MSTALHGPVWILGMPFLRAYSATFNRDTRQIGLAQLPLGSDICTHCGDAPTGAAAHPKAGHAIQTLLPTGKESQKPRAAQAERDVAQAPDAAHVGDARRGSRRAPADLPAVNAAASLGSPPPAPALPHASRRSHSRTLRVRGSRAVAGSAPSPTLCCTDRFSLIIIFARGASGRQAGNGGNSLPHTQRQKRATPERARVAPPCQPSRASTWRVSRKEPACRPCFAPVLDAATLASFLAALASFLAAALCRARVQQLLLLRVLLALAIGQLLRRRRLGALKLAHLFQSDLPPLCLARERLVRQLKHRAGVGLRLPRTTAATALAARRGTRRGGRHDRLGRLALALLRLLGGRRRGRRCAGVRLDGRQIGDGQLGDQQAIATPSVVVCVSSHTMPRGNSRWRAKRRRPVVDRLIFVGVVSRLICAGLTWWSVTRTIITMRLRLHRKVAGGAGTGSAGGSVGVVGGAGAFLAEDFDGAALAEDFEGADALAEVALIRPAFMAMAPDGWGRAKQPQRPRALRRKPSLRFHVDRVWRVHARL